MSQKVILCVDDEILVLDSLKEQLQNAFEDEFIIEIAESAEEALEIYDELSAEKMAFPVIIADFIMPNIKGDELLSQLHRKSPATRKIMLTGQASIEGVSNAVNKANLYRYINKPWDKEDMILTIKEALKSYELEEEIKQKNIELSELNQGLEQKVAERTKQLEELNQTKDKFFSIIAHDLKNPFNTLIGFTELIKENIDSYTREEVQKYITILHETAESGYALLENLLEWSRSQTGAIKMEPGIIDIKTLSNELISLLENSAKKKQVYIINQIKDGIKAFADYNMIHTILRNLISNAIKYSNADGEIILSSKEQENMMVYSVKDNGVGIIESNIENLFRIDKSLSTKGTNNESGTGLGLILCREFAEKNGGKIWVESEQGKGSTFFFSIPLPKG